MEDSLPIIMAVSLLVLIFSGYPVPFILGGISIAFMHLSDTNPMYFQNIASRMMGSSQDWLLLSIPIFIFMGIMLDKSGIALNLLYSLERLLGKMRGGLAVAVVILGTIMAASTGIVGASVVMLGLIGLPVMLREKYNPCIAAGAVAASGTLGILIPPSIMLVMFGSLLQISVGDLFAGAIMPGLALACLYVIFLLVVAYFFPKEMPQSEREELKEGERLKAYYTLFKNLVPPLGLILTVLGSVFAGIATPTEAASLGALGAILLTIFAGKMNWKTLSDTIYETGKITSMVMFVALLAPAFSTIFRHIGGTDMIKDMLLSTDMSAYGILFAIIGFVFILGFFLEWLEISYILLPMLSGVITSLDFGFGADSGQVLTWFAIIIAINLQTSFLTPPFGMSLFYIKGICPPGISMGHVYKGIIPFVILQLLALILVVMFPSLVINI